MNGKGGTHLMLVSMVRRRSEVNIEGGVCGARLRLAAHPTPDGMVHVLKNQGQPLQLLGLVEWASEELPLLGKGC